MNVLIVDGVAGGASCAARVFGAWGGLPLDGSGIREVR